jgi:hypothetical protein
LISIASACGGAPVDDSTAGLAAEGAGPSTPTYYTLRPDLRKCAYPMCGGSFIQRVNHELTRCVDGSLASECRVLDIDYSMLGFSADELDRIAKSSVIVAGTIAPITFSGLNGATYGVLQPTEVWQAATETPPSGTFYVVSGAVRSELNWDDQETIAGVDFSQTDASAAAQRDAQAAFSSGGRILVAGDDQVTCGSQGFAIELVASQLYRQVVHHAATVGKACGGLTGATCDPGQYCDVTVANACQGADLPGVCTQVPKFCPLILRQVCGCDGKTYGNDCERLGHAVQLDHEGPCQ